MSHIWALAHKLSNYGVEKLLPALLLSCPPSLLLILPNIYSQNCVRICQERHRREKNCPYYCVFGKRGETTFNTWERKFAVNKEKFILQTIWIKFSNRTSVPNALKSHFLIGNRYQSRPNYSVQHFNKTVVCKNKIRTSRKHREKQKGLTHWIHMWWIYIYIYKYTMYNRNCF